MIQKLTKQRITEIDFIPNGELTIGAEIEIQLIDPLTHNLTQRAGEILAASDSHKIKPELYLSTVEINSGICTDVNALKADIEPTMSKLSSLAEPKGIKLCSTGCHPFANYSDCIIANTPRYQKMIDRNQWLVKRMTVYGLHVHIGMASGDECIRFNNFFMHFLPHLLALSGSSPFWQGIETGLSSCRPTTYEAMPTAGQPYAVKSWAEFKQLYELLKNTNSIHILKDLWWDMRPSPNYGTLEIRVCDGPATLDEALAISAYIHLLAYWFKDHGDWINHVSLPPHWILRENKWRVMRHGPDAEIIKDTQGNVKKIKQDITEWVNKLNKYSKQLGYKNYMTTIIRILEKGNSSQRQKNIFQQTGSLQEVVKHNIAEYEARKPIWL